MRAPNSPGECVNGARTFIDHVLRHHQRIAGNVLADMTRHQPRLQVIFAAHADADQHIDGLAAIKIRDRLRLRAGAGQQQAGANHHP